MEIGIAGAGVLGRLLAWQLVQAGHKVTVFDSAAGPEPNYQLPRSAGFTAAGMLSPLAELESADWALAQLGWRSVDLWQQHTQQLAQHGHGVYFTQRGSLLLAHGTDMGVAQRLISGLQSKAPAGHTTALAQPLSPAELQEMEPDVSHQLRAWLLPNEGQIHSVEALVGLARGAAQLGAQFHWNTPAEQVEAHRINQTSFDWVFDVRGLGARPTLSVRGVRGEVFWLHAPGVRLNRPVRLMHPRHRVYVVPRPGDMIVIGASEIESEDRSPVSLRSTVEMLAAAHSVLPQLTEARLVHTEVNLRPALPDNMPYTHTVDGLTQINGLFRHGWLIAPAMVEDALAAMASAG